MKIGGTGKIPHPFPYQGSKRGIAKHILSYFPSDVRCLIEPFCGSGAISIAAAAHGFAESFSMNDLNKPLMDLWSEILEHPAVLCEEYERQWMEQQSNPKEYFLKTRNEFNKTHDPYRLIYLLARIVKGSVRYSAEGHFNQSPDNRRLGMKPDIMRKNIFEVSRLLTNKTSIASVDFRCAALAAQADDLVYMDPPYQGTSFTRDHRYLNGLSYDEFVDVLFKMNELNISYIISYDGATGGKKYGKTLPADLHLKHLHIYAGRSSQATLLGKNHETIESMYLSPSLALRLNSVEPRYMWGRTTEQRELTFA